MDRIGVLYEQYADRVRHFLLGKTHDPHLAEDLCADVFVKVCEKLPTYNAEKAGISTWIFTIARNTLTDYYRANKPCEEVPETLADEDEPELDSRLLTNESLEALAAALENLDPRNRAIIVAHYYRGKTLRDIAAAMGISYSYAKVLHQQALEDLRKAF